MQRRASTDSQAGIVSILTVLFFMIFISIIIVGFMAIVSNDTRQTTDNDLSQSAFSAARSGVEEGKRILLYCAQDPLPPGSGCTDAVLNNTSGVCTDFTSGDGQALANNLGGITTGVGSTPEEIVVGGESTYQQYITCLTLTRNTPTISSPVSSDYDYIVKLKTDAPYSDLEISWSRDGGSYAFPGSALTEWPRQNAWLESGQPRPSVLRVQLIPFVDGAVLTPALLDTIERESKTIFVAPCTTAVACGLDKNIYSLDSRQSTPGQPRSVVPPSTGVPLAYGACSGGAGNYSCSVGLSGFLGETTAGKTYYARISLIYGQQANVALSAKNAGTTVNFSGVQPWIDVTGRTNDVFRRVRAQVSRDIGAELPRFAIDSAAPICKDMYTTDSAATSQLRCTY